MSKLYYFLPPVIVDFIKFCKKNIKKKKFIKNPHKQYHRFIL
jgi:hypothetical protein